MNTAIPKAILATRQLSPRFPVQTGEHLALKLRRCKLRDHRNQARVDDALIRRNESKPPHPGSRHNRPIGGIPQRPAECCDLSGNLHREGHHLKSRIGIDLAEELLKRDIASGTAFTKQNRDLDQGNCADRNGLMPPNSIPQNARLLPRKLFGRCKPANGYRGVEKKARIQIRAPLR